MGPEGLGPGAQEGRLITEGPPPPRGREAERGSAPGADLLRGTGCCLAEIITYVRKPSPSSIDSWLQGAPAGLRSCPRGFPRALQVRGRCVTEGLQGSVREAPGLEGPSPSSGPRAGGRARKVRAGQDDR